VGSQAHAHATFAARAVVQGRSARVTDRLPAGEMVCIPAIRDCANGAARSLEIPAAGQDSHDLEDPVPGGDGGRLERARPRSWGCVQAGSRRLPLPACMLMRRAIVPVCVVLTSRRVDPSHPAEPFAG
jgi:hypothetical protein